ncbi:hypothetical protein SADUNF_Sadunf06G0044700 [Salix dunnii]|uniref:Leucine-rich repeat family protein n=1 Tax=Salix dunnii TaxID=1413687 RepID=A0A835MWR1_9ROSI|nr:hypothetical protein SADUNF_Sadunf06G0044700 [Salix dunnii]
MTSIDNQRDHNSMGGICSRKRDQQVIEDRVRGGVSGCYSKSSSSKWLGTSLTRPNDNLQPGGSFPSLLELCICRICEDISRYKSFSMLPRDISQQIFNELVMSHYLTAASLEAFRDCALQDVLLGEYPGVRDSWMDVISSQGSSLLSVDLSYSDVTGSGLAPLKDCSNLQAIALNNCNDISDHGLKHLSGLTNITSLSLKKNCAVTAEGMRAFSTLLNLENLDMERCCGIHGGLVHLKGLKKLESLNIRCCNCITDTDMKAISGLQNLKKLQISNSNVTDLGVSYLRGLQELIMLNLEGCRVTTACLDSISALATLAYLNLSRCDLHDDGFDKLSGLINLKVLILAFNKITDACLVHLKGLKNLESLNLDSCNIGDEGIANLAGLPLKSLELSDTSVSSGLRHLSVGTYHTPRLYLKVSLYGMDLILGMKLTGVCCINHYLCCPHVKTTYYPMHLSVYLSNARAEFQFCPIVLGLSHLENLNLSFTSVTDSGLRKLSGLTSLRSLNLDARQITDSGLAVLTSLTGLTRLDIFGAHITDSGTNCLKYFKNLKELEICGGWLTDAGVKNIKDLVHLTYLNLSQNTNLTDKTLELISGLTGLVILNVSNSLITNEGLRHLKPLKNLRELHLDFCKVTASEIKKLQATELPNLVSFQPAGKKQKIIGLAMGIGVRSCYVFAENRSYM